MLKQSSNMEHTNLFGFLFAVMPLKHLGAFGYNKAMDPLRKDLAIAGVAWRLRDAAKALAMIVALPVGFYIMLIILAKSRLLPGFLSSFFVTDPYWSGVSLTLITVAIEFLVLLMLKQKYGLKLVDFGLRKFKPLNSAGYVVLFYILTVVLVAISYVAIKVLWPSFNADAPQAVGFEFGKSGAGLAFSFTSTVVIVPIVEEIYFRGVILPTLVRRWGWLIGAAGSSILFAVLHFQPNVIIYTFLLGMFLSLMYMRLKSIVPGIFLHMLNNLLAFALLAGWIR
ncbi:CPBP family intramembrane metalloprotease [Candidatus Saccharibacteria bacterium]|nr:CPBP family intramembrane metalloprotease [Candidatus Saccharibacteria bacterium]